MIRRDENGHVHFGRWLDFILQALIIVNLITLALETLPNLTEAQIYWLNLVEVASIAIFTAEYIARCLFSRPMLRYAVSFYGIVDLLSILPFYLSAGLDLRSARVLRMMRLFRLFKLTRYSKAARRYRHAFAIAREELVLFGCAALIVLYLAAVGIHHFECEAQPDKFASVPDSMWWAMVTLTTVGYGDVYPITLGGRLFTSVVLLLGLGFVAVPTGLLAGALSKAREQEKKLEEEEEALAASKAAAEATEEK
ncbi:MAG: ion transporter [Verrucomicrobiaceae bacterium]|nr:ion transporter [Verrucomicrobiaceae bacterium]